MIQELKDTTIHYQSQSFMLEHIFKNLTSESCAAFFKSPALFLLFFFCAPLSCYNCQTACLANIQNCAEFPKCKPIYFKDVHIRLSMNVKKYQPLGDTYVHTRIPHQHCPPSHKNSPDTLTTIGSLVLTTIRRSSSWRQGQFVCTNFVTTTNTPPTTHIPQVTAKSALKTNSPAPQLAVAL